jgi:pre-60S factor REI1
MKCHSFFIPDFEYVIDLIGLLNYLCEKISIENVCLYCNGKGRTLYSLEAVRKHMTDKGHCKLGFDIETEDENIFDYYDFTNFNQENDIKLDLDEEFNELVLPCNKRIGHRSLKNYYKQYFRPIDTREAIICRKMLEKYEHLDYYKESTEIIKIDRERKIQEFDRKKLHKKDIKIGMRANNQKHYRLQIMF